ncbi:MAG: helix-turn-helix transcriptional regulator [Betaproteobacteria bacterium]
MAHPENMTTATVAVLPDGRMDTKNAARYAGLAVKTLAMMRCEGTGPRFVKRGRVFYFRADIDAWINAHGRLTSTAQVQR